MKTTLPFVLLLFIVSTISAQFEWEELAPHNSEHIQVIHRTENGRLIGYLQYGVALYASEDFGKSWHLISSMDELVDERFNFEEQIAERADGTLFTVIGDFVYEIDESEKSLDSFFEPDMFFGPSDLFFLENGQIVVANISAIQLYSSTGELIKSREVNGSFNMKLIKGYEDVHYAHSSRGLIRFNSDLSSVEEDLTGSIFSGSGEFVIDKGGNIFSNSHYSTDGTTWNEYPNGIGGLPTVTNDGDLHVLSWNSLFVSRDAGQTFETYTLEEPLGLVAGFSSLASSFVYGNSGIIYSIGRCPGILIRSENGVDNWMDESDNLLVGAPYSFDVEAVSDGFVIVEDCNAEDRFIRTTSNSWESLTELDSINSSCDYFNSIISFPDGTLFSDEGCRSTDQGTTWENVSPASFFSGSHIYYNLNGVYIVDFIGIFKSTDSGENWEAFSFDSSNFLLSGNPVAVSISDQIYTSDISSDIVYRMSLEGEVEDAIAPIIPGSSLITFTSSYSTPHIYMVFNLWVSDPYLMVYNEDNKTRVFKSLPTGIEFNYDSRVHVDHGNNLYLVTSTRLFFSPDRGENWEDITPNIPSMKGITDIDIGWDGHVYLATLGAAILKSVNSVVKGHNSLEVIVYNDRNGDCNYDVNENSMSGVKLDIGSFARVTDDEGIAQFILWEGANELKVEVRTDLYEICDFDEVVDFAGYDEKRSIRIGIQIKEECADLSISSTTPFLRRCFDNTYYLEVYNDGSAVADNTIAYIELDEYFDFISSDFTLLSQNGQTVALDIGTVPARQAARGKIEFNLSCDAELGQAHYVNAYLEYEAPCDESSRVTEAFECRENIGSYDPNDKSIYVDGIADAVTIGEDSELEYLIRFQNTGTDTAFTVRIEDSLSEDLVLSSLYPVAASHDYSWEIDRRNVIITFENILLPDSTVNETASHGFVKFRVELTDDRPAPGAIVENTAEIYFDFNEPIVTNTVQTSYLCLDVTNEIDVSICPDDELVINGVVYNLAGTYENLLQTSLGCDSTLTINLTVLSDSDPACTTSTKAVSASELLLFPLPSSDELNISYTGGKSIVEYRLINISGHSILNDKVLSNFFDIETRNLDNGIYLIQLSLSDGSYLNKRVCVVH